MIIVTGGAGFIGSNLVKALNDRGRSDVVVVDNLENGGKFRNLVDCDIADYVDKDQFLEDLEQGYLPLDSVEAIFHQGACSKTTEWDGRYMMRNNFTYSKTLLHQCLQREIPFIYASSAAVYGGGIVFDERPECEAPLNVYGYSKLLFDQYARRLLPEARSQIVGLRYFNVYGPREQHKGEMASVAYHFRNQLIQDGRVRLFEGSSGYDDGEQRRDFVYVDDAVDVNLWCLDHPERSGIFNVGTGRSQSFNDVANALRDWRYGELEYIPFPDHLRGRYQSFTEANIDSLRQAGYAREFQSVETGVGAYMEQLDAMTDNA